MHPRRRIGAGRQGAGLCGIRDLIEQCGCHLRTSRVVDARKQHGRHAVLAMPAAIVSPELSGIGGTSQRNSAVPAAAPSNWAPTKPGTSAGRIPAKVSVIARAIVTAGFANDVDAVNQYAETIYAPTA